jgi:Domain of unknown function (DUF4384)
MKIVLIFCLSLTLCLTSTAFGRDSQEVEVSAQIPIAGISPDAALTMAKAVARVKAVEQVVGVRLQSETLVRNALTAGNFIHKIAYGHVIEEELLEHGFRVMQSGSQGALSCADCGSSGNCLQVSQKAPAGMLRLAYFVRLRAKVEREKGKPDHYFKVEIKLNRNLFQAGDEMVATISSSQDCFLNVLNITADEKVHLLLPTPEIRNNKLLAGQTRQVPDPTHIRDGSLRLRVGNLPGHTEDQEAMVVIATKKTMHLPIGEDFNVMDLARWLATIPLDQRAQGQALYEIHAR